MLSLMLTGKLPHLPEEKTAASGQLYLRAALTTREGDDKYFVNLTIFDEAPQKIFKSLEVGDTACVVGTPEFRIYSDKKSGRPRVGLSIIVNAALTHHVPQPAQTPRPNALSELARAHGPRKPSQTSLL